MRSEDIRNRQFSENDLKTLREAAARQAAGDDSGINFDDMPQLTDEQLASMVRLHDVARKVPVSVRLDPRVIDE